MSHDVSKSIDPPTKRFFNVRKKKLRINFEILYQPCNIELLKKAFLVAHQVLGSVEKLFKENPFKESPPDRIRFPLYQYHFTDMKTWRNEGEWWRRQRIGYYGPQMVRDAETDQFRFVAN